MLIRLLLAADEVRDRRRLAAALAGADVLLRSVDRRDDFWGELSRESFDLLVVAHPFLPEPEADTLATIRDLPGEPDVIVVMDADSAETQARLVGWGAAAAVYAGLDDQSLADTFGALVTRRREESVFRLQAESEAEARLGDFVSSSPVMKRLLSVARRVAASDTTVLILGETGVGKEWLARAIHGEGPRSGAPFIAVNCGAIPETLIESELFGHEEGAFTGARRAHRGHFEMAHAGTIFLDEIAEMPVHVQVRLLRVLEERRFQRIGSEKPIDVDVRIMAATNKDPAEEIAARRMRSDLFYRLGVVTLNMPPLRERREDIPDLVMSSFDVHRRRLRREVTGVTPDAMRALEDYAWPGNVRELINVIERAVLLADGGAVSLTDLPENVASRQPAAERGVHASPPAGTRDGSVPKGYHDARRVFLEDFERRYFTELLIDSGGRVGVAAKRAGVSQRTLFDKMRRLKLDKERFKPR